MCVTHLNQRLRDALIQKSHFTMGCSGSSSSLMLNKNIDKTSIHRFYYSSWSFKPCKQRYCSTDMTPTPFS